MDQGGELYKSKAIRDPFKKEFDCDVRVTGTAAHHQNGHVERANQSVDKATQAMLIGAGLGVQFWPHVFCQFIRIKNAAPKIPAGATLEFEVELLDFKEKQIEKRQMTPEQRLEHTNKLKTEGTVLFKAQNFKEASQKCESAANCSVDEGISGDDVPKEERALCVSCWGNAAMCHIKIKDWTEAIHACNQVLEIDAEASTNVKALFRRGTARMNMGLLKEAKEDFMMACNHDKTNKDVRKALNELKAKVEENKKKEKAAYGGLFSRVGIYNDKKGVLVPNANKDNPHVFFDIKQGEEDLGR